MKPTLRKEASIDLRAAITGAIWAQFNRNDIFPFKNCLNCLHFTENTMYCKRWNARPPARVIAYSCGDAHDDISEIPF